MRRTIVIILSPYISHIIASAKVARHLQQRGFNILYVSGKLYSPAITRYGFGCYESEIKFICNGDQNPLNIRNLLQEIKRQYHPVTFIIESGLWDLALFLKSEKAKFLTIQFWACGDRCPYLPPFYLFRKLQPRNRRVLLLNNLIWQWSNIYNGYLKLGFWKRYRNIIRLSELSPAGKYISFRNRSSICRLPGVPELILYPESLDFPRQKHPDTVFLGPFVDTDRTENDFDFGYIDLRKPLVICSLGSLNHWYKTAERFYRKVIEAFRSSPEYTLVINVGRTMEKLKDINLPDNVFLHRNIPQLTLLKKSAVFITHGGASSMKEAIAFAVPMLVYPWEIKSDMFENAKRIEYHKLGLIGNIKKDRPKDIIRHVKTLLSGSGSPGLKHMQAVFEKYNKSEPEAIDYLESLINN
jgi:UDP:flavonoid glycosyltransferase YjiC (YdhE family)